MEPEGPETSELTRRMQKGEPEAYRMFYKQHSLPLLRYLVALHAGNIEAARESLQTTILKVAKYIRRFDDEAVFQGWLRAVAKSVFLDQTRAQGRYRRLLSRFRTEPVSGPNPTELRLESALTDGLEMLPEEERSLLKDKYFKGASVAQLAKERGLTEKSVEHRLARARAALRNHMGRRLKDE